MAKSFKTYKQLETEKEVLEQLLKEQKNLIRADIEQIKAHVKPLSKIRANIRQFTAQNAVSLLLSLSSGIMAKQVFKKIGGAAGGRIGKMLVTYFLKNSSSFSFFANQKNKVARWFRLWFTKEFKNEIKEADQSAAKQ